MFAITFNKKTGINESRRLELESFLKSQKFDKITEYFEKDRDNFIWIDLDGPLINERVEYKILSDEFEFHPLAIEDCVTGSQYSKIDDFDDHIFVIAHSLEYERESKELYSEGLYFFVGKNYIISYHRKPCGAIENARKIIFSNGDGNGRKKLVNSPDFILYIILDKLVDGYFPILEMYDDRLDSLEDTVVKEPKQKYVDEILDIKREILYFKRATLPQRKILSDLSRKEFTMITPKARIYFSDIYDSLYRITELVESYRDLASGTLTAYLSAFSNKLNEIMKVLTVIATIMMPLTVITGIYGMNFKFMPELEWKYGYFIIWIVIILVILAMLYYFRKKKIL